MQLNTQQRAAVDAAVSSSFKGGWFYLAGYAGTGKTTCARAIARAIGGNAVYCAFTGKAVSVLRTKHDGVNASTIHRLIYKPNDEREEQMKSLRKRIRAAVEAKDDATAQRLKSELEELSAKELSFYLRCETDLKDYDLVVVDEASMVPERLAKDLLSFGKPVVALGDPAQLPPVKGVGMFTSRQPDALLHEIVRQEEGSSIVQLAAEVRAERRPVVGRYSDEVEVRRGMIADTSAILDRFDMVLCGTNRTRKHVNETIRRHLGRRSHLPEVGDRLVCLRNDYNVGIFNGELFTVERVGKVYQKQGFVELKLLSDDLREVQVFASTDLFDGQTKIHEVGRGLNAFDYGWCLTVHKAQGSEWDSVLVLDESRVFRDDWAKHLYTAVTRARRSLTVAR